MIDLQIPIAEAIVILEIRAYLKNRQREGASLKEIREEWRARNMLIEDNLEKIHKLAIGPKVYRGSDKIHAPASVKGRRAFE